MILKSLKLNNIRSYIDEEIHFPEGSVLLSGDIGAGKSTILMAIEFALFGIMRAEFSGASLLRNGKNSGYVQLSMNVEGKEITIKRMLKRQKEGVKQEAGSIIIDGIQSDLTPQELKSKIISLIGYPDVLTAAKSLIFRYTVYTPQEEMKKIIFDDSSERLNNIRKIFGVDKYKTIVSNSEIVARKLGEEKRVLSERIIDLDEKIKQRDSYGSEIKALNEKLAALSLEIKNVASNAESKKQELSLKEKRFTEFVTLRNELEVIKVRLFEKDAQKSRIEIEFESLKKEMEIISKKAQEIDILVSLEGLEQGLEADEKKYNEMLTSLSVLRSKEAEIDERARNLNEEIAALDKKIKDNSSGSSKLYEMRKIISQKEILEGKFNSAKEELLKLSAEISAKDAVRKISAELKDKILALEKCPLCCQPIFEGQKIGIKEEQEKMLAGLNSDIAGFLSKKTSAESEAKEIEKKVREIAELEKEAKKIEGELSAQAFLNESHNEKKIKITEISKQRDEIAAKIKEMSGMEKLHGQIKGRKEVLKKARDIEAARKTLEGKNETRKKLETEVTAIAKDILAILDSEKTMMLRLDGYRNCDRELENSRKEMESCNEMLKQSEMRRLSVEKDIENSRKIMKTVDSEIKEKMKTKDYVLQLSEKQAWLRDKFAHFIKLVESHIMQRLHEEFDSYFRQWVSVLLEDESVNARLDEGFTPKIEQNGFEMEVSDFSGGEKTSFALAYRLALNKVINDVLSAIKTKDLLILDEPTDGFSSEQLDKLRDVLEQLDIAQVIIVSHEAKLESFVQSIIRVDKSHHVSRVMA